jgi:hypothetical protein
MSKDIRFDVGQLRGDLEAFREVSEGQFDFRASLPISGRSRYGDEVWSWYDPSNPRIARYSEAEVAIDWRKFRTRFDLPPAIIADLKKYVFLRYAHSKIVFPRTYKNAHPASIMRELQTLALFLSHLRKHIYEESYVLIDALSEIEASDIEDALSTYPMRVTRDLRAALRNLAGERFGAYLGCGQLRWNEHDVAALAWNFKEGGHYQRLPEGAFRLLSNAATADVKQFLTAIGVKPQDTTVIGHGDNLYLSAFENFGELFYEYVKFRIALKQEDGRAAEYNVSSKYVTWVHSLGNAVGRLAKMVDRARMAAQVIVTMYTGARLSELTSLRTNCLQLRGDVWVMIGTLFKHGNIYKPVEQDEWVAIPIVRDAVRILEEVGRAVGSDYLFHGCRVHGVEPRPMSSEHLSRHRLTPYLRLVDAEKKWWHLRPHAHQFRNSIVFEMRKAGLGLPFITYQLKHLFNELEGKANNTTLLYGGIGSTAAQMAAEEANLEALREIFHPDSPVAGDGAEEHMRRRAAYFQGMAVQGVQVDLVLRHLAKEGMMPLTDVGLGYCQGKKKVEEASGTQTDPPCIGGLRCNPFRCKNGFIPQHKRPMWKKLAAENRRRARDPEFGYAKAELEAAADEADAVVRFLDGQKRRKDGGE